MVQLPAACYISALFRCQVVDNVPTSYAPPSEGDLKATNIDLLEQMCALYRHDFKKVRQSSKVQCQSCMTGRIV